MKVQVSSSVEAPETPHLSLVAQTGTKGVSREPTAFETHPEESAEVFETESEKGDLERYALCDNSTFNLKLKSRPVRLTNTSETSSRILKVTISLNLVWRSL